MSRYVTPFLVINLGSEMVFVVAQRLQAQNVAHERSALVLDEIISVLVSQQLITEITKPQAPYSHESLKNIIEDVTQSSAMRLDPKSMDKLWDLITMVFKWQLSLSQDILKLTSRHLYEIENYVTLEETQLQLHKVQNIFDNFTKVLSPNEKVDLRESMIEWLQQYNVRVSLLLRLGLQDMDGNFIVDNLDSFAEDMLRNLGENIYCVSQSTKALKDVEKPDDNREHTESFELKLLAHQIIGDRKQSQPEPSNVLKLAINQKSTTADKVQFDNIETNCNQLQDFFSDLNVAEETGGDFHDDLINMIENGN